MFIQALEHFLLDHPVLYNGAKLWRLTKINKLLFPRLNEPGVLKFLVLLQILKNLTYKIFFVQNFND